MPCHKKNSKSTNKYQLPSVSTKKYFLQWSHTVLQKRLLRLYTKTSTLLPAFSQATQQAVVVMVQMACKCVSAYLDERARAHAFFVTLAWLVAQRLLLNVWCVCVCVRRVTFFLWFVGGECYCFFVCFKSSLTVYFLLFRRDFF